MKLLFKILFISLIFCTSIYSQDFVSDVSKKGTSVRVKHIVNSSNNYVTSHILGENDEILTTGLSSWNIGFSYIF